MKNLIFTIIFCGFSTGVFSQTLDNTSWESFHSNGSWFMDFSSDTLYASFDGGLNYFPIATYQENIDSFMINDVDPAWTGCWVQGNYTFVITNDTLDFTLVSDTCSIRIDVISDGVWVNRLTTDIEDVETEAFLIKAYPNPASHTLFIESGAKNRNSPFIIFNQLGQQILSGQLTNEVNTIDIEKIPPGMYYLQIVAAKEKQTIKIMKQ